LREDRSPSSREETDERHGPERRKTVLLRYSGEVLAKKGHGGRVFFSVSELNAGALQKEGRKGGKQPPVRAIQEKKRFESHGNRCSEN